MNTVRIGNKEVGLGHPTYIVAEIGINHNGSVEIAKKLIDVAVKAGADAVKFQTRTVNVVYTEAELAKPREVPREILQNAIRRGVLSPEAVDRLQKSDFRNSTNGDLKYALEFNGNEYFKIDTHCRMNNIAWFTSCWDAESFHRMQRTGLFQCFPCHKIASACNEDDELLRVARASGKPIILSTGMTEMEGVRKAVEVVGKENLILLHCTSVYPKATGDETKMFPMINLRGIRTLADEFGVPIGFSSHDGGIQPTYAAVARGAVLIENHITLARGMWGSDQGSSIEPRGYEALCLMIRQLEVALGDGKIVVYQEEEEFAKRLRRVRRKLPEK